MQTRSNFSKILLCKIIEVLNVLMCNLWFFSLVYIWQKVSETECIFPQLLLCKFSDILNIFHAFFIQKNLSFILIKSIQNICLASFFKLYQYDRYLDKICDTQHKLSFMREMKIAPKNNANDNYQTSVKSSS